MHNNYHFLRKLIVELNGLLVGNSVVQIFSQDKDELLIEFSNSVFLRCYLRPDFTALQVLNHFSRARKNTATLWPEIYGLMVEQLSVFKNERAIKIQLGANYILLIKLFAAKANVVLFLNGMAQSLFNNSISADLNLKIEDLDREIQNDFQAFRELEGNYRKLFFTFGKEVHEVLDKQTLGLDIEGKWAKVQEMLYSLENPKFYVSIEPPKLSLLEGEEQTSAISALNNFVTAYLKLSGEEKTRKNLLNTIRKDISKTESYVITTESKLSVLKNGVKNEEIGNILMANLHEIKNGIDEVELLNFYTGKPVKIRLKQALSVQKNAEVYYRKAKNEKVEIAKIEENISAAKTKLEVLKERLLLVENADDFKTLKEFSKENNKVEIKDSPFKEFEFEGVKIWVGRNAKNNDLLITQYTQKDEWWLHAKDTQGSHVVVKTVKSLSPALLEYAASLAAYYSKRKSDSLVTVIYTQRKYVRKSKNLAAGQVVVERESTLLVEPAKLSGLK